MRKWAAGPNALSRRRCHRCRRGTGAGASRLRNVHAGDRRRLKDRVPAGAHAEDAERVLDGGRSGAPFDCAGSGLPAGDGQIV